MNNFDNLIGLMRARHSVRSYLDAPVEPEKRAVIDEYVAGLNKEYGTNIVIFYDDIDGFKNAEASYGLFKGCKNYALLIGKDAETCGYAGELLALKLQDIGLNSCFVALTYNRGAVKAKVKPADGEKIQCNLAFGYGENSGVPHKSKPYRSVSDVKGEKPETFDKVVEACLLAPTAINQQKFKVVSDGGQIDVVCHGIGFYTDVDLGIVKAHKDLILGKVSL